MLVLGVSLAPAAFAGPTGELLLRRHVTLLFAPAPELPSRPLSDIQFVSPVPPPGLVTPRVLVQPDASFPDPEPSKVAIDGYEKRPDYNLPLYVAFAALQVLDAHSTTRALQAGSREANSIMAGIAGNDAALYAVKGAAAAATIAVVHKLSKQRPVLASWLMVAFTGVSATIVVHNYRAGGAR